ncbi:dihydrolipoamide acetyltransferase family protein [Marinilabilia sp.]|uniref:dihydrolipoamide acetyltransferase family protein n=1 Tax=Marinilabilia sp. TaxID=2021252 RepID=UPI0025BACEAA|nr:dihydrolipoamide acetyltransferase family protein [Marinilabilia sp.]
MSTFEILMPKMGESVEEATITKWFVKEGDTVEEDDPILEIATDKVDSEIPSPVAGTIKEIKFEVDDVVAVGTPVAIILLEGEEEEEEKEEEKEKEEPQEKTAKPEASKEEKETKKSSSESQTSEKEPSPEEQDQSESNRFYSPLVRSIAKEEGISFKELDSIEGSGREGRVTKDDLLDYLESRGEQQPAKSEKAAGSKKGEKSSGQTQAKTIQAPKVSAGEGDEIKEMDRLRKLIADNMVMSKQVSPHVTSVVEADVTNLVLWRNKVKDKFQEKYGEKLTFMPMFTEAVAKSLRDFPGVNVSVDGHNIILRKNVNVGIAVSLPSGNLIVPVIKQADQKNVVGIASEMNRLADAARNNKLSGDDIQGGTFTITNFGSFKNTIGTPIINQPQVAILATGTIEKKPAVIETPTGDVIAIRHKMFLSLSYDHRVVDGALGGMFLRRIADYLEQADLDRDI